LAEFRGDLETFIDREAVQALVAPGRRELPRMPNVKYFAGCDPSGGGGADSFTLAIAYLQDSTVVLAAVRERRPPYSPSEVVGEFSALLASYGINEVTGDRFAGTWPQEQFRGHGIAYRFSERAKSQIYLEFLPILNAGRIELLDHPRLVAQICGLERRTVRGSGRDVIDHAPSAHDDLCNSVAMVAGLLKGRQSVAATGFLIGVEAGTGSGAAWLREQAMRRAPPPYQPTNTTLPGLPKSMRGPL
jgi:hypothetical protein